MDEPKQANYLIRCNRSETDLVLWWGPNRSGYTVDFAKAGRYTQEDAEKQARRRPHVDVAVPEPVAFNATRTVVWRDALHGYNALPEPPRPKVAQRCGKCGRMMAHDANPYEPCRRCEDYR